MSNRKYPRLSDGYHERSPYHPYQTKKQANCIADSRERDRSPSGSNSKDNSPYSSSRHSNLSPRSQRSKYSYSRSKEGSKKGSNPSPNDSHHESNSHSSERRTKFNHISTNEEFPWSQHVSSSGKVYYYNFKTEKSQWEKPKEWIERERRKKESEERVHGLASSKEIKETGSQKEDSSHEKSRSYPSKYSTKEMSNDKKDGNRMHIDDRGRENHQLTNSDRGQTVIKTVSAHTSAQSTASHRTTPVAATLSGNSVAVSPAGSLQDVSPPSTPSSRASIFEPGSHSSSPQLISVSPHGTPYQSSQSPLGQSRHGLLLQTVFQSVSSTSSGVQQYTKPQYSMQQPQLNSAAQYGLVNNGNTTQNVTTTTFPATKSQVSMDVETNSRPALHPLQQATLLHQRQISESRNHALTNYQQPFPVIPQTSLQQSPAAAVLVKENNRIHQSPSGSPVIFTPNLGAANSPSTKEQFQPVPHIQTSLGSTLSSAQTSPSSISPVQPTPTINLQALAKYVDKSLTSHTTNWPSEGLDRQVQRLNEESSASGGDASKIQIQQLHLQSQLDLLEMRLNVGSKRVSSMKEVTKTLEQLLAESDKKSLT